MLAADDLEDAPPAASADLAPADGSDDEEIPFGEAPSTRFGADVEYAGRAHGHDYVVRVRHRLLDTTVTLVVDGVEHDPKTEAKAAKRAGAKGAPMGADDLGFRYDEGFTRVRAFVMRPDDDDADADADGADADDATADAADDAAAEERRVEAETVVVRTTGLGGAGEVDVELGLSTVPLAPADGSSSAERDRRRTEQPAKYALIAAATTAARYVIPVLGIGALFSGLLRPVREWAWRRVEPAVTSLAALRDRAAAWLDELTRPVREAVDELTRPIWQFLDDVTRPVREAVGAALRWLLDGFLWLWDLLFGWLSVIPDEVRTGFLILAAFLIAYERLRNRRDALARSRDGEDGEDSEEGQEGEGGEDGEEGKEGEGAAGGEEAEDAEEADAPGAAEHSSPS
ncbi:hypothetical protein ACXET9_14680 [Brachybacterium sp. DNPG3]